MRNRFILSACIAVIGFALFSFTQIGVNGDTTLSTLSMKADPITVTIPFEPLRIHRATTDRPRDGKNCGCNECFGLCNAPIKPTSKGQTSYIGLHQSSEQELTIFLLDKKPSNFEKEFGIDEEMTFLLEKEQKVTIKTGEYAAIYEEGLVRDKATGKDRKYFSKIVVSTN